MTQPDFIVPYEYVCSLLFPVEKRRFMGWSSEWIRLGWGSVSPLLRKSFAIHGSVQRARLTGTALGVCELRLNGAKVGDTHLLPGWTDYRQRVYLHTFDVTDLLLQGENVLGGMLGAGWFAGHFGPFGDKGYYGHDAWFSAELEIEYQDGTKQILRTDSSWKGNAGPILESDLLMGESYDARKEIPGWDAPGFEENKQWLPVSLIRNDERLPERIEPYPGIPIRTIAEIPAQSVTEPQSGIYVFDLGQNMVGVVRLKVNVPSGTEVVLKHGEMLNADGTVYTENLRSAKATDRYIAKGTGEEIWQPRFTFHGFRYVEVHGLPATCPPPLDTVTGVVWMSALKETASFECSNAKVNQLFSNIQWGFRGNYLEVPTDCPQRDERLGWTGDTQIFIRSATYLADVQPFFKKWLVDLHDAQHADGGYPDMAPFMGRMSYASAAWADAGIICPYVLWKAYGDTSVIRDWWMQMKKFMELICTDDNRHNGPNAISYGDWLHFNSETPVRLIGLAYRAYDARLMAEMASALGETADAVHFSVEAVKSRALFRAALFQGSDIAVKTQTACALAVAMDLLSGDDLEKTKQCLVQCLEKHNGYLTTGFVGTGYLCPALTKAGRCDLAVQLLLNEEHPSWLYEVNNGATTIWERWNSWIKESGFGDVGMNSFNHYAFGSVCEWMFESLAGFRPAEPGFARIIVEPCFTAKLDFVKASYESIRGRISVIWRKTNDGFFLYLETPVDAEVRLPSGIQCVGKGTHSFKETT
jgi:alpha-L-rhamnosidase